MICKIRIMNWIFIEDNNHDPKYVISICTIIMFILCTLLFYSFPLCQATILFLQMCYNLKKIMNQLDLNEEKSGLVLKNTQQLIENVKLTSKFLSPYCLVFILIFLFTMMFCGVFWQDLVRSHVLHFYRKESFFK